jgi:hypothetical protein
MNDKCVIEHKKEIAKCLVRPLIQTNPYEVSKFLFLLKSLHFFFAFFYLVFFFFWSFEGFCESWLYGQIMERRIL